LLDIKGVGKNFGGLKALDGVALTVRQGMIKSLIGPNGAGKTTTIAKLAANFKLRQNKKVGLITIDTYRIAAVEQLKTYAQIIEVPLEVAMSPEELKGAG
jgi:flagellar biosynthesis protein FlhF